MWCQCMHMVWCQCMHMVLTLLTGGSVLYLFMMPPYVCAVNYQGNTFGVIFHMFHHHKGMKHFIPHRLRLKSTSSKI